MINIEKIYKDWLKARNTLHFKKRYQGHEKWFHASSSGMCMRKHYFQHVAKVKPRSIDKDTLRLFRLGDLVHEDIQEALSHNKQIVIPSAGIGTGLARLSENAPNTFAYLQEQLQGLMGNSD